MADSMPPFRQEGDLATPLHLQQLERSLDIHPFLSASKHLFAAPISSDEESSTDSDSDNDDEEESPPVKLTNGIKTTKDERRSDRMRLYNFDNLQQERQWLKDVLVSNSSESDDDKQEITEMNLKNMLKMHLLRKKWGQQYYTNAENCQYQYYGAGVLSNFDKFPEHQRRIIGNKKKKRDKRNDKSNKKPIKKGLKGKRQLGESQDQDTIDDLEFEERLLNLKEEDDPDGLNDMGYSSTSKASKAKKRAQQAKNPEVMAIRRRKIWMIMSKKELGKVQRAKANNHKEMLTSCKRVAQCCMKYWRQKAMQSQKNMKETIWRAKRLTREMQAYWKRYDRVERDTKRRQEKEAEEQRKLDGELMEAKRQQRKLNFLITQTELYAHFMSKKLVGSTNQEQLRILSQLEEEKNPRLASMDDYDSEVVKFKAKKNVEEAMKAEQTRTRQFAHGVTEDHHRLAEVINDEDRLQPDIFHGLLKHYQLKGMNWLANLYDQGINGILADEMGLGKTVQSIAFLCHIAEKYDAWGPFLIISPASTLHNWQQEMARFVPDFKVVPYWGSPQERKILRQFWEQKDLHTRDASFHVVITSYQLVITDFKYFNRIRWQYLILDEAQALKSTNSVRWKLLLGFSCRNRLLLSGTPIQNSMAELWALLHFIMPTMFDSHDEFNEWFSKDIESHAENKTGIDEKHLSRLHLILKPFMLRRIKKDVENELSDKIEVMVYCPLTTRQKLLYSALKKKIRIEDLLYSYSNNQSSQSVTSSLMNLVMQFRKVCNHPELFERREAKAPLFFRCEDYELPRLMYDDGLLDIAVPSNRHLLGNKLSVFSPEHVHRSVFGDHASGCFSFARLCDISPREVHSVAVGGLIRLWSDAAHRSCRALVTHHLHAWRDESCAMHAISTRRLIDVAPTLRLSVPHLAASPTLSGLTFTSVDSRVYTFTRHAMYAMQETMEHRIMRSKKHGAVKQEEDAALKALKPVVPKPLAEPATKVPLLPEFPHIRRPPRQLDLMPTETPAFLSPGGARVAVRARRLYVSGRRAAWAAVRHEQCGSAQGTSMVMHGDAEIKEAQRNRASRFFPEPEGGIEAVRPSQGWHNIVIPDKQTLVTDAGKLYVLDGLLKKLKEQGHRVLIYSQMTRMIDLLEEYMWHRKHTYIRLDGSSKISDRRDMVADFQSRDDIFVFLLSTRAGGLGINLTAADTVIFYDSDWNPTVDQQAMDRAHRLGQTKQVTVYRLICKGSIEERILQRAREKSEIQRMVISGGNFKPDTLKPKEVVSLLLDDEEIEKKYRQKQAEKRTQEDVKADANKEKDRKRKQNLQGITFKTEPGAKRSRFDECADELLLVDSTPGSPCLSLSELSQGSAAQLAQDDASNDALTVDVETATTSQVYTSPFASNMLVTGRPRPTGRGGKRGRPRGSKRGGCNVRGRGGLTVNMTNVDLGIGSPTVQLTPGSAHHTAVRRGPGRPRLNPVGPSNRGVRGMPRARKPPKPLLVPVRSGSGTPGNEQAALGYYTQTQSTD